jgi:ubiquinone/menaquinone biosynthesis C-methylase UbiE
LAFCKFREDERNGWDRRAYLYANATARATCQSIPALLASANLFPDARVLDAGCGPGYVAGCASILGSICQGVDFAPEMIAQARKRFPHIPFEVGDIEKLKAEDSSQDAVLSNIALFHVADPLMAMKEAFRVLKPGGVFAFSQWCGPAQSECYKMLFDVLLAHADMSLADPAPDAYKLSDPQQVTAMLEEAGFSNIAFEYVSNVLHAPGPSFFDFFMDFGVRIPLILDRQDPTVKEKIRQEIDKQAADYFVNGHYRIPMPSLIVSARRPETANAEH